MLDTKLSHLRRASASGCLLYLDLQKRTLHSRKQQGLLCSAGGAFSLG